MDISNVVEEFTDDHLDPSELLSTRQTIYDDGLVCQQVSPIISQYSGAVNLIGDFLIYAEK